MSGVDGVPSSEAWLDAIAQHIQTNGLGHDDLLFPTKAGTPISRNTFRTRIWLPAVKASGVEFAVRSTTSATPTPPGSSPAAPTYPEPAALTRTSPPRHHDRPAEATRCLTRKSNLYRRI
jgi:hypothetical protein